jgi:DNA repair photolyase
MIATGVRTKKPREIRECIVQIQMSKFPAKEWITAKDPAINSIRIEIEEIRKRNYVFIASISELYSKLYLALCISPWAG